MPSSGSPPPKPQRLFERAPLRTHIFLVPALFVFREAAHEIAHADAYKRFVEMGVRHLGLNRVDALVTRESVAITAQVIKNRSAIHQRRHVIGIDCQRAIVGGQRILMLVQELQDVPDIAQRIGRIGLESQRPIVGRERFLTSAETPKRVADPNDGAQVVWTFRQRFFKGGKRPIVMTKLKLSASAISQCVRVSRSKAQRAGAVRERFAWLPELKQHMGSVSQRIGEVRL